MLRSLLNVVLLLAGAFAVGASNVILEVRNDGYDNFGVFFVGDKQWDEPGVQLERLVAFVPQGQTIYQSTHFQHGFVVRTSNMEIRMKVVIDEGENEDYPFKISFFNLSHDDNAAIELKHGESGYIWIDGGNFITHMTGTHHQFTINAFDKSPVVTFSLQHPSDEL